MLPSDKVDAIGTPMAVYFVNVFMTLFEAYFMETLKSLNSHEPIFCL